MGSGERLPNGHGRESVLLGGAFRLLGWREDIYHFIVSSSGLRRWSMVFWREGALERCVNTAAGRRTSNSCMYVGVAVFGAVSWVGRDRKTHRILVI